MSENIQSLFKRSAWSRFLCYLPIGYLFSFFLIAFLYEILGWKWLEFAYPWDGTRTQFLNYGLLVSTMIVSVLWVWRKPIFRPLIRVLKNLDKAAE